METRNGEQSRGEHDEGWSIYHKREIEAAHPYWRNLTDRFSRFMVMICGRGNYRVHKRGRLYKISAEGARNLKLPPRGTLPQFMLVVFCFERLAEILR